MKCRGFLAVVVCASSLLLIPVGLTWAQQDGDAPAAAPSPPVQEEINQADNAWMLTSSALVLMMTGPGLALFYCGLVRKKNVLSVMMQCFFLMGLMTVLWAIYGYSLAFGSRDTDDPLHGWIGGFNHVCMQGVQREWVPGEPYTDVNDNGYFDEDAEPYEDVNGDGQHNPGWAWTPVNGTIPTLTHMLFQGMFVIITPALICGAFAERMKFSTMTVFMILWATFVYCPLCHWVWGGGILGYSIDTNAPSAAYSMGGALDFAGGTVVHISSGVSALICALLIGKRLGFGSEPMPPHNLTYTVVGAALLWVGWFGFNAGSELASDGITASAFAATHFSAAAGVLAWAGMEWILRGKPTVLGACSGAVAGLVCITPAAGFVQPMWGVVMGLAAGVVCYFACTAIKSKFGYDDSLDAFGVHGVGGTLGAILTGVFATRAIWDISEKGVLLGAMEGGGVLASQIIATLITWVFAAVVTLVILKVLDVTMGLRATQHDEIQGLDLSQHGEEGYIFI